MNLRFLCLIPLLSTLPLGCAPDVRTAAPPTCTLGAAEACYSGPAGTQGVGVCTGGVRTCAPDGSGFGACAGEVVPRAEACSAVTDESCDGAVGCTGATVWARAFPGVGGEAVAVDHAGNVLVTGTFSGTVDFGGGPLTAEGEAAAFVLALDPAGHHRWSRVFGGATGSAAGSGVGVDAAGDVFVTGSFQGGSVDFGGGPLDPQSLDVFVLALDPAGHHRWSRRVGGPATDEAVALAVDPAGGVAVLGEFADAPTDLGAGPVALAGHVNGYVVRFDAAGEQTAAASFGGPDLDIAVDIAVTAASEVLVTGSFREPLSFGGTTLTSAGTEDIFLAELSASGQWAWARRFGGAGADVGYGVRVGPDGNIALTGLYTGAADFGGPPATPTAGYQPFLVTLTPSGDFLSTTELGGGAGSAYGATLAVDSAGNGVMAGDLDGATTLGGGPLSSAGGGDVFVAKYDAARHPAWTRHFSGAQLIARRAAVDAGGATVLVGSFSGTVDFGAGPLSSVGAATDMFLVKLAP